MGDDSFVGRGGQLLLIERRPFCPIRDCQRERRVRSRHAAQWHGLQTQVPGPQRFGRLPRPVLNLRATPRMDFSVQRALFPNPTVRPRRRTP